MGGSKCYWGLKFGAHLRTNLKEIVAVEHLLVAEGWLENPCEKKTRFENLDQTSILDENLTQFCVGKTLTVG
jgi:hypothetical protein